MQVFAKRGSLPQCTVKWWLVDALNGALFNGAVSDVPGERNLRR